MSIRPSLMLTSPTDPASQTHRVVDLEVGHGHDGQLQTRADTHANPRTTRPSTELAHTTTQSQTQIQTQTHTSVCSPGGAQPPGPAHLPQPPPPSQPHLLRQGQSPTKTVQEPVPDDVVDSEKYEASLSSAPSSLPTSPQPTKPHPFHPRDQDGHKNSQDASPGCCRPPSFPGYPHAPPHGYASQQDRPKYDDDDAHTLCDPHHPQHAGDAYLDDGGNQDEDDTTVWPGQDHWKRQARAAKMARSHTCLARLDCRTRTAVKVLLAVLLIGGAVGIGVGISKPLGAPMWRNH